MTTRAGGVSVAPFDSMNVGVRVGDDADAVHANRRALAASVGAKPIFLHQIHGRHVVALSSAEHPGWQTSSPGQHLDHALNHDVWQADAAFTLHAGVACVVQVADCLPVLFAANDGRVVGAAHAGWRGLAAGVLESTVHAMVEASGCTPSDLNAWLGPCIGPAHFEVGAEVLAAFERQRRFFNDAPRADGAMRWRADLPGIARARLHDAGVKSVVGGVWCTVSQPQRFFSYRRDKTSGRHAAAVWIKPSNAC